ncbi:hypothetical protein D5018_03870 [Parashewanella curva]|uniref:Uncharacterized protein n=1 Tax=Parashewanella curva TaxID=2338552 RepID=A0A3L8Q1W2_9GAMM|nr:hypothetical protein [Parashewanella curva]RLV60989.1 hypothetical protein D5018_03870 [Parashewanella curva]
MHPEFRTIKKLRSELRLWGNYSLKREFGQGFPSRSACDRLKEPIMHNGGNTFEHEMPREVQAVDRLVNRLSVDCRKAIRVQYQCGGHWQGLFKEKKSFLFWLKRAELALLGE